MFLSRWQKCKDNIANCAFPDQAVGFDGCLAFCTHGGRKLSQWACFPPAVAELPSQPVLLAQTEVFAFYRTSQVTYIKEQCVDTVLNQATVPRLFDQVRHDT